MSKAKFQEKLRYPDEFKSRMTMVKNMIESEFKVPIAIGIVIAYDGGGPLDFMIEGNMHPQDMAWAANVADVMNTARVEFNKEHAQEGTPLPETGVYPHVMEHEQRPANDNEPPALPPQQVLPPVPQELKVDLSGVPESLRKAILEASQKGEITVTSVHGDDPEDTDEQE